MHPNAGYIIDAGSRFDPEPISTADRDFLRGLAVRVAEIATLPIQDKRRQLWIDHNELRSTQPLYILYPEDGWNDLIPLSGLKTTTSFWRNCEWYLRHIIWRAENIDDDFVTPYEMTAFVSYMITNEDFGFTPRAGKSISESGSWVNTPILDNYDALSSMKLPELKIDVKSTERRINALIDVFGDIMPVTPRLCSHFMVNMPGQAANLRGIEQLMYDMYDEPENLHALMEFLTEATIKLFREFERSSYLTINTTGQYVDSGGNSFSDSLPTSKPVRLSDLWGFGVAQEFSEISPELHYEFGIKYQKRVLDMFGRCSYGCCEPYTNKFAIVKQLKNLRRVSVSPWCDIYRAAEELGDNLIFSWKPNPATVLFGTESEIRKMVRNTLDAARGCKLEMFLKDIINLKNNAYKIPEFASILRSELARDS
jgi:hypothetical protein